MIWFVNICDDGRGSFLFGQLWPTEREAQNEARYLLPCPLAVAVSVDIYFAGEAVRSAIRAIERVGACA